MSTTSRIAVVGTGGIGGGWAAYFLSRGFDVVATDPHPNAERNLRGRVARYWQELEGLGLAPGASMDRLQFVPSIEGAVESADFVQESGPERLEIKHDIYRRMSAAASPDTPLVSSSSSFLVSDLQRVAARPERVVLGHPFNPPYLVPLVEVAGSPQTSEVAIDRVMEFYKRIGKKPIRLKREIFGHIANRLQTALWREAFHLIASGVASAEDVDTAMTEGPGMRGAVVGPCMVWHVSGGEGGIRSTVAHMGPPFKAMVGELHTGELTDDIFRKVIESTEAMVAGKDTDTLRRYRDDGLLKVAAAKMAFSGHSKSTTSKQPVK
jgi:carnitine 3-dehydrogenase